MLVPEKSREGSTGGVGGKTFAEISGANPLENPLKESADAPLKNCVEGIAVPEPEAESDIEGANEKLLIEGATLNVAEFSATKPWTFKEVPLKIVGEVEIAGLITGRVWGIIFGVMDWFVKGDWGIWAGTGLYLFTKSWNSWSLLKLFAYPQLL